MQNITPIGLLSAAIRRERERVNLSVTELAKRAGIAKSTLSQLEAAIPAWKRYGRWRWRWMCRSAG